MQIILTVTEGPHQGREFTFDRHDTFIVGRARCAHFRLPTQDRFFSRVHFMVEVNPPQCRIVDLGSRNGTWVNGERVQAADLKDGDLIRGGKTTIRAAIPDKSLPPDDADARSPNEEVAGLPTVSRAVDPEVSDGPTTNVVDSRSTQAGSTRSYDAGGPVFPRVPSVVSAADPAAQARAVCLVCGAAADSMTAPNPCSAPAASLDETPICAACRTVIAGQPQHVPSYWTVRELGRGGMRIVYLAVKPAWRRLVALKMISPERAATRRDVDLFLREARILCELKHPNIVAFREVGEASGQLYFAMDFVPGRDAAQLLVDNGGPLAIPRAVRLCCQLLEALEYAHERGFVHRDIKPDNLLVTCTAATASPAGESCDSSLHTESVEIAMLADFGLARTYHASRISGLTLTGQFAGTVQFMAPDQLVNYRNATPAVDIYSTGATLYNLLTNKFAYDFTGRPKDDIPMLLQQESIPIEKRRRDIPKPLAAAIHRSLAREAAARFSNAAAMRSALEPFAR